MVTGGAIVVFAPPAAREKAWQADGEEGID